MMRVWNNRGGANGTLVLDLAAKAPPDGHTLVIEQTGNLSISVSLTKVGYDTVRASRLIGAVRKPGT